MSLPEFPAQVVDFQIRVTVPILCASGDSVIARGDERVGLRGSRGEVAVIERRPICPMATRGSLTSSGAVCRRAAEGAPVSPTHSHHVQSNGESGLC